MNPFKEYPKVMSHPSHQPAKWQKNPKVNVFEPGTTMIAAEVLPPVTVLTLQQEQYYAARGYRPNSVANPAEYEQVMLESTYTPGYAQVDYPKWKYHAMEIPVIVKNAQEEAALGDGWCDSPVLATEDDLILNPVLINAQSMTAPVEVNEQGAVEDAAQDKIDKRSRAYKQSLQNVA